MEAYYPNIDDETLIPLRLIQEQVIQHPDYFTSVDCPYDEDQQELLSALFKPTPSVANFTEETIDVFLAEGVDTADLLIEQASSLYSELLSYQKTLGKGDTSQQMNTFKTRAQLIEKILNIKERARGVKEINEFFEIVMNTLDQALDKDQVATFMSLVKSKLDLETSTNE